MFKTAKQQVGLIAVSILLAGFCLACIVNFTDPFYSSWITRLFFYISLFMLCLGVFTILGLGIRQWLWPKLYILNLSASFRQALLLSLLIVISFMLLASRLLFWWVELSIVLLFLCVEFFFNLKI